MNVLVAYASRHGATRGIAERIAQSLERGGLTVSLKSVDEIDAVEGFDAYVIGSAVYYGQWMKEATAFAERHQDVLATRPVWLFSSGPTGTEEIDAKGRDVRKASEPTEFVGLGEAIHPRDRHVFFGAWDPDAKPVGLAEGFFARFLRFLPAVRESLPVGDFRDWPEIEGWAEGIARELQPVGAAVATTA